MVIVGQQIEVPGEIVVEFCGFSSRFVTQPDSIISDSADDFGNASGFAVFPFVADFCLSGEFAFFVIVHRFYVSSHFAA